MSGVCVHAPDPASDFGMYAQMDAAFEGLHDYLDELRRNQGRIGYGAQNAMSDLSKAFIEAVQRGASEEDVAHIARAMEMIAGGFDDAVYNGDLAESSGKFSRTIWQEQMEAELFGKIWPVITGVTPAVPELLSWRDFKGNVQAFLYGYLDLVGELSKAVDSEEFAQPVMVPARRIELFEHYLVIADSITLRLSQERHIPGYVISNGFGRWMAYSNKLRDAYGTIAHKRREHNSRRHNLLMQREVTTEILRQVLSDLFKPSAN